MIFCISPLFAWAQLHSERSDAQLHREVKLDAPPAPARSNTLASEKPLPPAVLAVRPQRSPGHSARPGAVLPSTTNKKPHELYRKPKRNTKAG